jgi:hypothetical protein
MNTQHTPGQWINTDGGQPTAAVFATEDRLLVANCAFFSEAESLANARLIAAAPELLAALEQIKRLSLEADRSRLDVASMLGDIARAAIAKAVQS